MSKITAVHGYGFIFFLGAFQPEVTRLCFLTLRLIGNSMQ